ncbi:hypothetical protein RSOLAG1IB_07284 [Rhizoctonia solani AG-1 IB]|uniref:Peptidase C14 caspase domain-containing protein n=1 Tax=Thanatephorus cucumeris (strain AG1-IB / isolate 7/3/14) TaxID=1108050 RepID=A0A0B7FB25_THACB|nr:hypothetical protein RSOLAG1IB_07284 [Rhizoctonia solani AG-1 IB]
MNFINCKHDQIGDTTRDIVQTPIRTLHALLIGIDTYKNFSQLSGAVNDAKSIKNFLVNDLAVPESHITTLMDKKATRSSIIGALEQLSKDNTINRFDPILIFYSGHGCEINSPLVDYEEKTQCWVPWDAGRSYANGTHILESVIPDYIISALLKELAISKGNNITVILDCCHSASSTRGLWGMPSPAGSFLYTRSSAANTQPNISTKEMLPSHCRARLIDTQLFLLDLTHEADEVFMRRVKGRRQWRIITAIVRYHICIRTRARTKLERKKTPEVMVFSRSHILLAACGYSERAYECTECNSGYFTTALLRVFRSNEMHMLKYKRCFEEFPRIHIYPTSFQGPVCEGDATMANRPFFTTPASISPRRRPSFAILEYDGGYQLMLGDAQGVSRDSQYDVYEDHTTHACLKPSCPPSADVDDRMLVLRTTYPSKRSKHLFDDYPLHFWRILATGVNGDLPKRLRAKLHKLGPLDAKSLKIFISEPLKSVLNPDDIVDNDQGMVLVDSADPKDTSIVVLGANMDGDAKQVTIRLSGSERFLHKCDLDAESVRDILTSMARWWWHRSREPQIPNKARISAKITVHELGGNDLEQDDSVTVESYASSQALYYLRIKSHCPSDLYPYLFYCSTSSQSIRPLYLSVYGSHHIDPPLERYGTITCGYDNDDMVPGALSFNRTPDDGYLVLFLTTAPGDFDLLPQSSPFIHCKTRQNTYSTNQYGDGLKFRKFCPSALPRGSRRALDGRAVKSIESRELKASKSGRQKTKTIRGLEQSERELLPPGALGDRYYNYGDGAAWGVVRLKVKCR